MRVFTAIPIPDEAKKILPEITRGKLPIPYINVTNLHITLNFLGELTDDEVLLANKIFPGLVGKRQKIEIEFDNVVNFRNQIHLTLKENTKLRSLQKDLEEGFTASGFHFQDRQYYPHVKLGSMHIDNKLFSTRKLENFPNETLALINFTADKVALFESKLLLHHAHHKPLLEIDLI